MRRIERKWEELKIVILSYIWLIWLASSSMTFRTLLCISSQICYYIVQNIFASTYPHSLLLSLSQTVSPSQSPSSLSHSPSLTLPFSQSLTLFLSHTNRPTSLSSEILLNWLESHLWGEPSMLSAGIWNIGPESAHQTHLTHHKKVKQSLLFSIFHLFHLFFFKWSHCHRHLLLIWYFWFPNKYV